MRRRTAWAAGTVALLLALGVGLTAKPPEAGTVWRLACVASLVMGTGLHAWFCRRHVLTRRGVWVWALALRALVFPLEPSLSDDGYRYLWDGTVQTQRGLSPYAERPSDVPVASALEAHLLGAMNSPDYYSVYPPVSQGVFALASWIGGGSWTAQWYVLKGALLLAELVGIGALLYLVGPAGTAVYALHPLAVLEVAGQGHTEALVVGSLGLVLVAAVRQPGVAGAAIAVAGWVKLYPFAWLLGLVRTGRWRVVAACAVVATGVALPYAEEESVRHVRESLALFGGTLDFYSAPYLIVKAALYGVAGEAAGRISASLMSVIGVGTAIWLAVRSRGGASGLRHGLVGITVVLVLAAPTLHPWYLLPVLFVLPLLERQVPILWLAAGACLSYVTYVWEPGLWPALAVGWGGALLTLGRSLTVGSEARG